MLKRTIVILTALCLFTVFTTGTVTAQEPENKDDWQFYIDLYGWMPNIYGESAVDSDFELDLDDILDNLQFMVMATPGVQKGKWGVNVDVIYMDLGDDKNQTGKLEDGAAANLYTDVELKSWIVTPKVFYSIIENEKFKMNFLAGARYLYMDVDLQVNINGERDHELSESGSDSGSVWDAIVGIAGEVTLNERWFLPYYADIGAGETDMTCNLFGGFGYRFSRVDLMAGWRYLRWNFDDNSALDNMYISGPIVGAKIKF